MVGLPGNIPKKGQRMKQKQVITYVYRGRIERGTDYRWCDGYSQDSADGLPTYPWMTRQECIRDAKSKGEKAQFYTPPGPGAKRFEPEVQ